MRKKIRIAGMMPANSTSSQVGIFALFWCGNWIEGSFSENGRALGVAQKDMVPAKAIVALEHRHQPAIPRIQRWRMNGHDDHPIEDVDQCQSHHESKRVGHGRCSCARESWCRVRSGMRGGW